MIRQPNKRFLPIKRLQARWAKQLVLTKRQAPTKARLAVRLAATEARLASAPAEARVAARVAPTMVAAASHAERRLRLSLAIFPSRSWLRPTSSTMLSTEQLARP